MMYKNTKSKRRYRLRLGRYIPIDPGTIMLIDQRIKDILDGNAKFCRLLNWDTLEFEFLSEEENQAIIESYRKEHNENRNTRNINLLN